MTSRSGHGSTTVDISEDWPLSVTEGGHFFVTSITPKMTTANNVRSSRTSVNVIRHHLPSLCFRVGGLSRSPLLGYILAWASPYCQPPISNIFSSLFPARFRLVIFWCSHWFLIGIMGGGLSCRCAYIVWLSWVLPIKVVPGFCFPASADRGKDLTFRGVMDNNFI